MVALEFVLKLLRRLSGVAYSGLTRLRLGSCGIGLSIRYPATLTHPAAIKIGDNVSILEHAWLNCESNPRHANTLAIGSGCHLGRFLHVNARESVIIEDNVLIADKVFITDYHHGAENLDVPIIRQPLTDGRPVRIGEGSWIGEGAAIFPGVTIGRYAIVGANAVVTHDVPERAIARGVPARIFDRSGGAEITVARPR